MHRRPACELCSGTSKSSVRFSDSLDIHFIGRSLRSMSCEKALHVIALPEQPAPATEIAENARGRRQTLCRYPSTKQKKRQNPNPCAPGNLAVHHITCFALYQLSPSSHSTTPMMVLPSSLLLLRASSRNGQRFFELPATIV